MPLVKLVKFPRKIPGIKPLQPEFDYRYKPSIMMDVGANFVVNSDSILRKIRENLILSEVKINRSCVLGQGSYGTVYKAKYNGIVCAAKRLDVASCNQATLERMKQNFKLECLQHSKLSHPNIVKMLGVFWPKKHPEPVLVMELMEYNLTQLLENHQNICKYIKLSILQDVSRGLCYLHEQNPPIIHHALYSDNILLTQGLIAKISDFKTGSDTVSDQALLSVRQNRDISGFLPDSTHILKYDVSLNVFSFGCIVCHIITQRWPGMQRPEKSKAARKKKRNDHCRPRWMSSPWNAITDQKEMHDDFTSYTMVDWSRGVEKHQNYLDQIGDNSLKQLVEACLQRNSKNRPSSMLHIYEKITSIIEGA